MIWVLPVQSAHDKTTPRVIGPAMAQNSFKSIVNLSCAVMLMKGEMTVYVLDQNKFTILILRFGLTAIAVAGKKTIVKREMLFIAEESRFVSRAICCCMRLYSCLHQYVDT